MEEIVEYVKNKKEKIKKYVESLKTKPVLGIVQVNDDVGSTAYVKGKIKDCFELGVETKHFKLDKDISEDEIVSFVHKLNNDSEITGFIVQMPLPSSINEERIKREIDPKKDVDGFNPLSSFDAATPKGILRYLKDQEYEFKGKNAVILGRSNIVGKPMAKLLLNESMNVTVLHSKTSDFDRRRYLKYADLIIVAIGKEYYVDETYELKKDAVIFDVGINRDPITNKLKGDCKPNLNVYFQSPVPKGVGLLTRLSLIENLLEGVK